MLRQQSKMGVTNNVAKAPLVRISTLSTIPMMDDLINILAIHFVLLLSVFKELFDMAFWTLFLATLQRLYLLARWRFILRTFSIHSSNLLVEDR